MSCDCHVIWGQSLLVVFSFFCEGVNLVGEKETINISEPGLWMGKEREKGREEGSTCMTLYARSTCIQCIFTPKHIHTCIYVHVHTFVLCMVPVGG